MRNTKQKELILNIINNSYSHPTAYDVYLECKKEIPNISLGTVYRNLNTLVEMGSIQKLKSTNNIDRYDKTLVHSHIICNKCGRIDDIFYEYDIQLPELLDYDVIDYDLCFNGICNDCKEKEN